MNTWEADNFCVRSDDSLWLSYHNDKFQVGYHYWQLSADTIGDKQSNKLQLSR